MERRWFVWGFLGEDVDDPWGDAGRVAGGVAREGRWQVPDDVTLDEVVAMLRAVGERTSGVLRERSLEEPAVPGGRFEADPPKLGWICFHVLQEYARHTGHLDIAVELAGGDVGE